MYCEYIKYLPYVHRNFCGYLKGIACRNNVVPAINQDLNGRFLQRYLLEILKADLR